MLVDSMHATIALWMLRRLISWSVLPSSSKGIKVSVHFFAFILIARPIG